MLRVVVESAKNLPKKKVGSPDPITTVIFKGEKKKTKSIDNELNPEWNEVLEFDLKGTPLDSSSFIDVIVKDYETIGKDKLIGSTKISLRDLASGQVRSLPSKNVALSNESGQNIGATVNLVIGYDPPANAPPNPNDPQAGDAAVDAGGGGGGGNSGGEGDETDGGQGGSASGPPTPVQSVNLRQRSQSRYRLANKPQDFQIRVRVIEARQLSGNNIKPVVKVYVCGQTHRTRIKRGNNPFFDEMFFYNVHMLPTELFDEHFSFRVYDSSSLRADCLMGEFKLDIGYVYDEPAHCVMRKWVLLNDPDDSSSGAKGYLKVSLFVVGAGDEPPMENRESSDDKDDIESNLLLPAGVTLRWATLSLKVFRAEDVPQMDDAFVQTLKEVFGAQENKKNLVDPYLEARFAGKKLCTQIIEKNANPEWNQVLRLQVKFPSMCESVKLTVFDWDRLTGNDPVGTSYLNLSRIASSGGEIEANTGESEVGFLPVFGPCYINLYGSPREFTGLPDPYEDLNYGKGEGVAYRGRILVALTTKLDEKVEKTIDSIHSDDILVAQKYQRRRKYSLCAVFHSASMIQEPGEPIQFEVSIGNYGNKLDNTCKPLASTTQYSCAVFDGNHYYYLPWANTKPVVAVTSFWEDISHRLDAVNIILYITRHLQSNLEAFKTAILAKVSDNQLVEVWLKLLNQLIEDIESFPTPQLEGQSNLTSLDIQIKKLRDSALNTIKEGARRMREEVTEIRDTLNDIESWAEKLNMLAEEPQNSMPDVIIWMLRGEKRVAYIRIPAHEVLFSTHSEQACGQHCGKTWTVILKYPMDKNKGLKVPIQIRINMWLGLSAYEKKFNSFSEGTFSVFAELYENQAKMFGKWGTTGLVGRHKYSDVTGKLKLKQEYFMPPRGWEWEGDWFIDPEKTLLTEADAGHTEFMDEVYQNETRFPSGEWKAASEPYTDVNGEKSRNPGEFDCPPGWTWEDKWTVDENRAVDDQGWEYGVTIPPDDKPRAWVSTEKMYHVHRRRRLVRPRKRNAVSAGAPVQRRDQGDPEGWEFSSLIGWKFHRNERSSDTFRRRRWRRKMSPEDRLGACAIFQLEGALGVDTEEKEKAGSKDDTSKLFGANTPTVSCIFAESFRYHLRVYVYQARNLIAMDKESFSDPYAHISFLHHSKTTEKSACQSKRTRLQKVKPKPNLLQISRTAQPKSHITKNTTDTESSTTQIPESNKRTIAVVEPKQACFTSPVKTNPPAPDCLPSLGLDFTVKKNTDVGLFGQEDSGAATSGQSAIENLNLSEDQLKSSREQARTQTDSKSESTDEKTMSEVIVSGSNPATPERSVPEPQVEQWSSTDSAPVKENSSLSASFVTHVEDLPVSLQAESKAADACQPRRSRLPKVKTKPNLPQASRTARCKPQINKDSINKDSSPAPIPKFTPPEKTTRSTVPTSCLKPPFYLGSSLTQTEESSTTEGKTTDVFGQEDSGATSSGQRASESQKLFTVQFQPSKQQTRGVTTSESIECSTMNPVSADSAVTESVVGQGSNKESGPAKEDGDHSVAHVRPVVELADSQTIEDEAASTCQSKISSLQKVKPKPNLPQTTRKTLPELQSTEDPMMQKPSSSASHSEFSDHPTAEVEAQPTCSTSLAETSSVSLLSLELVTHDEELSSTEGQKTDVEVGIHSSSESSETNVPQRRRRFPKVKPKPNLTSSIRTTRSNLQPKDIKLEKPQINKPVDINSARAELEPEEHDMRSINCPLKTQLLTSSAFPEMSLESTNDMGASSDMIATSGIDNQSMLTDSVPEIKNGENFTEEKTLCNDKVEGEPALKGDCKLDMPTRVTERNTQPTDHPTAISNVHSSEVVLTSKADPTESSHPSCPVSYSEGQSQDVAQQCSEISKNNQTSNDNSPSANRTDESQSESTDSSSSLRKASSTRRGRLKPRPKLGRSTQPPRRQQVQSTSQVEAESCSHIVDTSVSQPESELRPEVQEPVEGAVIQHIGQDSPLEDSGSSLSCLTKITSIQSTSTSSQEGTQNHPGLSIFPGLLSQQVPSDPDEPFFILSLTEIPVCSSGEVVDRAVEPLSYLPLTDASIQQQRCVPGESLAAAEDGSRSEVPVPRSTEESVEMSLINVNDIELDLTTHMGSIVKNPVDAHEGTTVQSATFSENVDNNEVESTTAKQKLTGTRGRAKLQVKSRGARQTKGSKTLTRNTIQDLHHHHGPSVQPEVSDASDEVVTEPQKGSGDQAEIKEETQTHKRDSCSAAPTRMSSSRSRNPKDFLPENNSTAASSDHARGKAVSKSSRAAGEPSSTTLRDVPGTPSRTQTPHATHSELSTMSPTQTEVEVRQTPMPSTSQCTAEVSAFQQSDDSIEEPTSISQYFLSDIFTDVEEG